MFLSKSLETRPSSVFDELINQDYLWKLDFAL